jgi:hypothetical protein
MLSHVCNPKAHIAFTETTTTLAEYSAHPHILLPQGYF